MEAEFRQDLCRRTMVIKRNNDGRYDFREKMVTKNRIRGMVRISIKHLNGGSYYVYDLGAFQTLDKVFDGKPMGLWELRALFSGINAAAREAEKYLLDFRDILMDPKLLLWDIERGEPAFCYYPGNPEGNEGYEALGRFLMDVVDKDDDQASRAAYGYYERIVEDMLLPEGILKPLIETPEKQDGSLKSFSLMTDPEEKPSDPEPEQEREPIRESNRGSYYSEDTMEEEDEEKSENPLICLLFFIPAILSSAAYGFLYLSPSRLTALGISDSSYIRAGIGLSVISGLLITAMVYFWNRRKRDGTNGEDPDSQLA